MFLPPISMVPDNWIKPKCARARGAIRNSKDADPRISGTACRPANASKESYIRYQPCVPDIHRLCRRVHPAPVCCPAELEGSQVFVVFGYECLAVSRLGRFVSWFTSKLDFQALANFAVWVWRVHRLSAAPPTRRRLTDRLRRRSNSTSTINGYLTWTWLHKLYA